MRWTAVAAAVVVMLVTACGGGSGGDGLYGGGDEPSGGPAAGAPAPGGALTVSQALDSASGEPLLVQGAVVAAAGQPVRLCELLAESYPPQCGGASLIVEGLDVAALEGMETASDVTWGQAELLGTVADGVLTVSSTSI